MSDSKENLDSKNARSIRNMLIDPLVQVRLGLYSILLALFFSITVFSILWYKLGNFADIVISLTDVEEEVRSLFQTYMEGTGLWLVLATIVFLALNIIVSIIYTHKLIGPSIAFKRQIDSMLDENYNVRVNLRKGDSFLEIADSLNKLAAKLEKK